MTLSFWSFFVCYWRGYFRLLWTYVQNSVFQLLNVTNDISHMTYHVIITSMYILKFIFYLFWIKSVQNCLAQAHCRSFSPGKSKNGRAILNFNLFWDLNESSSIFSDLRLLCKLLDCFDFRIHSPNLLYHQSPMFLDEDMTMDHQNHLKFNFWPGKTSG